MSDKKCSCGCGGTGTGKKKNYTVDPDGKLTLDKLPIGASAVVEHILPEMRDRKKFADIGLVPGASLVMEAHAPFGGLLRIRILETSMALHREDAAKVILKKEE